MASCLARGPVPERARAVPLAAFLAGTAVTLGLAACPSLEEIPLGVCGNGVIERDRGEDCDTPQDAPLPQQGRERCAAPGEAFACSYVWDDASCCPGDYAHGIDGRCRMPSGSFVASTATATATLTSRAASELRVGDIDGDGWPDLLVAFANNNLSLLFFSAGGNVQSELHLQRVQDTRAALGTLAEPDVADEVSCRPGDGALPGVVLLPTSVGARVFAGRAGPGLLSKVFAAYSPRFRSLITPLPLGACVLPPDVGDFLPPGLACPATLGNAEVVDEETGIKFSGLALVAISPPSPEDDHAGPAVELRTYFPDLTTDAVARSPTILELPGWAGCGGLAIPFGPDAGAFSDSVVIIGFCGESPAPEEIPTATGEIIGVVGHAADEIPFAIDVTGDGIEDVVLVGPELARIRVGDGAGNFTEAPDVPPIDVPRFEAEEGGEDGRDTIALGFVDDDDVVDFVQRYTVWTSGGRCELDDDILACDWRFAAAQDPDQGASWTEAVLADLNGDGRLDVAAARTSQGGYHALDVLLSSSSDTLNPIAVPTAVPPRQLVAGDFDGDAKGDVAYVVGGGAPACDVPDALDVVFGGDVVSGSVTLGEIPGIISMGGGPFLFSYERFDGVSDLGVTTECDDGVGAALLFGNPQRTMESPYAVLGALDETQTRYATGRLLTDESIADAPNPSDHPDLVALSGIGGSGPDADLQAAVWLVEATGDADLAPLESPDDTTDPVDPSLPPKSTSIALGAWGYSAARAAVAAGPATCDPSSVDAVPDCLDDAVIFFSSYSVIPDADLVDAPRLVVIPADTPPTEGVPSPAAISSGDPGACPGITGGASLGSLRTEVVLDDFDLDGRVDALGWWTGLGKLDGLPGGGAVVFWNGPEGFGGRCPESIPVDGALRAATVVRGRISRAVANPVVPEILLATTTGTFLLAPGKGRSLGACQAGDNVHCVHSAPLGGTVEDVAAIDFDQDGLEDIVVAGSEGLRFLTQLPLETAVFASSIELGPIQSGVR